jgi:hypothetical protein
MLLEPGPLPQVNISQYPTAYDTPDFEVMVTEAWSEIDSVTLEMDSLIDPTAIFSDVLTGDTILSDLDAVDQLNGDQAHLANLAGIDTIDTFKANGDAALTVAIQSLPGEVWSPVPATTVYGTVAQPGTTAAYAGVTLLDLGTNSGTQLIAGDLFQLQVKMDTTTGKAADYYGVQVYAWLTRDGVQQPHLDLGTTDSTGMVTYQGQWQPGDVGNWTMVLHAQPTSGGEVVSQVYQWVVAAGLTAARPPRSQPVTVQLIDWTTQDLTQARVGDTWQLFVTGPPQAGVFIWGTYNGAPLTEVQIGTTDLDGNFTVADKWNDSDAGQWIEYYSVGRMQWPSSLSFTVQPRAA